MIKKDDRVWFRILFLRSMKQYESNKEIPNTPTSDLYTGSGKLIYGRALIIE